MSDNTTPSKITAVNVTTGKIYTNDEIRKMKSIPHDVCIYPNYSIISYEN